MSPRQRASVLLLGAVLVVVGALVVTRRSSVPALPAEASRTAFTHAFTPGRHLTYDVDYRSEAVVDTTLDRSLGVEGAPRSDTALALSSTFAGRLDLAVFEVGADGSARALATLGELRVSVRLGDRPVALPEDAFASLARGFLVDYGADGEVRRVAFERDTAPTTARLASQLLAFLQLRAPVGHGATWETDEKDPLGDLHARYAVTEIAPERAGDVLIEKNVSRTIAARASGALGRLLATGGTAASATIAYEVSPTGGIVVEAAGALTTEQLVGELRVGSDDSTIVVRLEGDERTDLALLQRRVAERAPALAPPAPLDPVALRVAEQRREQDAILARIDLDALVADARAHPPAPQSREAATYARILAAAVEVSSEARDSLEKAMLEPAIGERAFAPLVRAFGENGSPEAQAALVRVVRGRAKADPGREVALFSLGRADAPTDATVAALETLASSNDDAQAYAALLALGRVAGQLAATAPSRGGPVLDRLVHRMQTAPTDAARARALDAIGNAGSPAVETELARWARAEAPVVRRAAVSAYRLVPTTTARDALVAALKADPEVSVRSAALEAVLVRPVDDVIADAIADRLEHDPEESVKKPAASRLITLCRRSERACAHAERLRTSGDDWTRQALASFRHP